MTAAKGIQVV